MSFTLDPLKAIENGVKGRFEKLIKDHPHLKELPAEVQAGIDLILPALAHVDETAVMKLLKTLLPAASDQVLVNLIQGAKVLLLAEQKLVHEIETISKDFSA